MLRNKTEKVVIKYLSPVKAKRLNLQGVICREKTGEDCVPIRLVWLVAKQTKMAEQVTCKQAYLIWSLRDCRWKCCLLILGNDQSSLYKLGSIFL